MAKLEKLLELSQEHLDEDEKVVTFVKGLYSTKSMGVDTIKDGIFLATDKRIVFYAKRMFGRYDLESFPASRISSVQVKKRTLGYEVTFYASGNKVNIKHIQEGQVDDFIKYIQKAS